MVRPGSRDHRTGVTGTRGPNGRRPARVGPRARRSTGASGFNRKKIRRALECLSDELARRGVRAELSMVGDGAIAMAYSARRVTRAAIPSARTAGAGSVA